MARGTIFQEGRYSSMEVDTMNNKELVSVIVPVYNGERNLKECINSIRHSKYNNIEIILVDDGSTDCSGILCDEFSEVDKRIRVIHKKNGGLSAARFDGVQAANGKWIMFVDDDDLLSPYAIEAFSKFFSDDTVDIIAGGRSDLDDPSNMKWADDWNDYLIESGKTVCNKMIFDRQKTIITPMWGKVYRKCFLERMELNKYAPVCPTIFLEDILMTPILYSSANRICIIKNIFYVHREISNSISRSMKLSPFFYEQIDSGDILLEYYKNKLLPAMYDYQLNIHYRTILRIYSLIDYENVTYDFKETIKSKIVSQYNKYYRDFLKTDSIKAVMKIFFSLFRLCPDLWGKMVAIFYYRKVKE